MGGHEYPVPNETTSLATRATRDGRTLTYQMEVVQQPEKARACGSGAKSSADRRPVDPPPIVELRIFEGAADEEKRDITFMHMANFFLYTTLEHARPMAQGRVAQPPCALPVLTGTPVAGVAYLDRPKPAGYFIFPDLSVRHEGKYRLSFNLYEDLKEPEKDADPHGPESTGRTSPTCNGVSAPQDHVHFRLEVKSAPFAVFSAKRFPGLKESTVLSRMVNDQGCRVRIRRDVRMRRRDKVMPADGDDYATSPYHTPGPDRPRSISHGSVDMPMPMPMPYLRDRRPSQGEASYYPPTPTYHPPGPVPINPPTSASSYTSSAHLSFGGASGSQFTTPTMPAPPPTHYPAPQHHAPPPPMSHSPYNVSPSGVPHHNRQLSGPSYPFPASQANSPAQYSISIGVDSHAYRHDVSRRSSGTYSQSSVDAYGSNQAAVPPPHSSQPSLTSYPHHQPHHHPSLTPLNTGIQHHQPPPQPSPSASSYGQTPPSLPPIASIVTQSSLEPKTEPKSGPQGPQNPFSSAPPYLSTNYHTAPSSSAATSQPIPISHPQPKRMYASVFDNRHVDAPVHAGMRHNQVGADIPQIETDEGELVAADGYGDMDDLRGPLVYKRADGTRQAKKCPSPRRDGGVVIR